jgi:steroid 5-alpha reductase family enzyme
MTSIVDFFTDVQNFSISDMCYTGANAYAAVMFLFLGTIIFILNKVTNDYSWVDRLWSLLPIGYSSYLLYFQVHCDKVPISPRQVLMYAFILVWGLRLTYNFWRKGGYTSSG